MDRFDKIQDSLKQFRCGWIGEKIEICRKMPISNLQEQTERVLLKLKMEQIKGRGENFCYLVLFHFRSSVLTGTNRYQISAVDDTLYLNPPLAFESWIPETIYNDKAALRNALEKELRKHFVRLSPFEIEYAVRIVLEDYHKLVEVYWRQVTEEIIKGTAFQSLQKHCSWKILSGTYMDDMKVILQSENRR